MYKGFVESEQNEIAENEERGQICQDYFSLLAIVEELQKLPEQ